MNDIIYIGSRTYQHHRLLILTEHLKQLEEKSKQENIPLADLLNEILRKELEKDC